MSRWEKPAPFLRRICGEGSMLPLPEGWETLPAGSVGRVLVEVAFDPLRHDVLLVGDGHLDLALERRIAADGWMPMASTDSAQIWSRAHLVAALRQRIGLPAITGDRRGRRLIASSGTAPGQPTV